MVGKHHYERIIPDGTLTELLDELSDTLVQIVEGIEYLVVKMVDGYIPRRVAAQGGESDEVGLFLCGGHLVEFFKGNPVVHAPF